MRQPLIATCSLDRSVHLWNYVDRSCELTKTFSEEAYSIAIHPTGLQVCCTLNQEPCTEPWRRAWLQHYDIAHCLSS